MAEESENFGHAHPLILLNEGEQSDQSEEVAYCSRCGEEALLSAPRFRCVECSGFYLHKKCAEAPSEINHPFHPNHPLLLLQNQPYASGGCVCDFCDNGCTRFVYHCSCGLDFHIKCALFTYNIAQNNLNELEHVAHEDPSINSTENDDKQLGYHDDCFGCREPLASSVYFSPDCGFNLHKKCAELPLKINHMWHRKHPLFLQFNSERLSCKICQQTRRRGFLYCCLPCKFAVHIQCVSPSSSPIIEDKCHQHPFTLFWRRNPFICDACGTEGNRVAYLCLACNIMVHEECASLPGIIKSRWHHHRIFHTYFLQDENFQSWDCIICLDEVKKEHGGYCCSDCEIIAHVNCATKDEDWYYVVSEEDEDEKSSDSLALSSITCVIERNEAGEATKVKHLKHIHNLTLSGEMLEFDKYCDGCLLLISPPYFHCSECDFVLHKACAELPKKKEVWYHDCQRQLLTLISDYIFKCEVCDHLSNGFGYNCNECKEHVCFRCVTRTLTPGPLKHPGHPHPLFFYIGYECPCCACGGGAGTYPYYCKGCNFALEFKCVTLPPTARHKCDTHLLALTYHEDNDYSETHYCDICEESRDPNKWFYHCTTCKTSAHVDCVLGEYPFIKLGSIHKDEEYHPHPLTFVRKMYYYPECIECGEPCQDLALECAESGCNYIVHWECIKPRAL